MATVKLDPAKGVQIPNMTTTERNAVSSPETGALIWNTTTSAINQYNGSAWEATDTNTQADISGKLNLSGGTMTGGLSGTTAAFSSTITSNGQAQLNNNNLIGLNTGATSEWIAKRTSSGEGIHISTTNASGADTQRLAITCNANTSDFLIKASNVGIGETSPSQKLHVAGNIYTTGYLNTAGSGTAGGVQFADGNLYMYRDTNDLVFKLQGSERMRIDSSGKVGIGATAPGDYSDAGDNLVVFSSGTTGMTLATSNTSAEVAIHFADGDSGDDRTMGGIVYQHASNIMRFGCANDYPLYLGSKKIVGRTVMNLTSGSNRWDPSGQWGNLGGTLATTSNNLQNQPSGCLYLCEAAIQYLAGYAASMLVFKTSASSGGEYQIIQINNTSGEMRMNGHYVQYRQNSGADQTGTSGYQRISAIMGTGVAV